MKVKNLKKYYVMNPLVHNAGRKSKARTTDLYYHYDANDNYSPQFKSELNFIDELDMDGYEFNKIKTGVYKIDNGYDERQEVWRGDVAPSFMLNRLCKNDWKEFHNLIS